MPLISLIVFSLGQWENWFWGWQVAVFLNVFAVVAGVMVLSAREITWRRLLCAAALGVVATYTFACGLGYWAVGLVLLLLAPRERVSVRRAHVGLWIGVSVAAIASYAYGYHAPAHIADSQRLVFLYQPQRLLEYVLIYLGSPVSAGHPLGAGLLGLAGLLLSSCLVLRLEPAGILAMRPYLCLSLYAVMAATMTGVGRLPFGIAQASSPRYVTIANLLWISNVLALSLLVRVSRSRLHAPAQQRAMVIAGAVAIASIGCSLAWRSLGAVPRVVAERDRRIAARAALLSNGPDHLLEVLYPDPKLLRERAGIAQQYGLSIYRSAGRRRR